MKKLLLLAILLPTLLNAQFENVEFRVKDPLTIQPIVNQPTEPISKVQQRNSVDPVLAGALQTALNAQLTRLGAVGLSAAVQLPDNEIWSGVAGMNGVFPGDTLRPDMVLGIGSVSKTITAACIMQLEEEGKLSINDPLHKWLPSYPNIDSNITIKQLLNHTSGIYNYTDNPDLNAAVTADFAKVWDPEDVINQFVRPRLFQPGRGWAYSNTNYVLLGLIVESVTGNSFHSEVRARFIDQLNLTSVALYPQETPTNAIAQLWYDLLGTGSPINMNAFGISLKGLFSVAWSAGAYMSTPADIAAWMKHLMKGEVVSTATVDKMKDFVTVNPNYYYGLGISRVRVNGRNAFGHGGDIIYKSLVFYIPDYDISIAIHSNDGTKPDLSAVMLALFTAYVNHVTNSSTAEVSSDFDFVIQPNPAKESFSIEIDLPQPMPVSVMAIDPKGEQTWVLHEKDYPQGVHRFNFDNALHSFQPGVHFVRLMVGNTVTVKPIILMK